MSHGNSVSLCFEQVCGQTLCNRQRHTNGRDYSELPSAVIGMSKVTKLLRRQTERGGEISDMGREGGREGGMEGGVQSEL